MFLLVGWGRLKLLEVACLKMNWKIMEHFERHGKWLPSETRIGQLLVPDGVLATPSQSDGAQRFGSSPGA